MHHETTMTPALSQGPAAGLRLPVDVAREAVTVRDLGDRILYWNRGAEQLYGWSAGEVTGRRAGDMLAADADAWTAARLGTITHTHWSGELSHVTRAGDRCVTRCRWMLLHDGDHHPAVLLCVDTPDSDCDVPRPPGSAVRESITKFAGELAHDLNNALAPVVMAIKLLAAEPLAGEARDILDTAEASAERAVAVLNRLHALADGGG